MPSLLAMQIEEKVLRIFQNKEIAKERNEETKLLMEEVEDLADTLEEDLIIELPNGEFAIVGSKVSVRDKFDKEGLANELLVSKDDLDPFGISLLTANGRLTPDMITRHTKTETQVKVRVSKRKSRPRPRGRR